MNQPVDSTLLPATIMFHMQELKTGQKLYIGMLSLVYILDYS